jgi:hypothetical protein
MNSTIHLRIEANRDHPIAACFDEAAALANRIGVTVAFTHQHVDCHVSPNAAVAREKFLADYERELTNDNGYPYVSA